MLNRLKKINFIIIPFLIFCLDFSSKFLVINYFDLAAKGRVYLTPFLDFILVMNSGISYGLFSGGGNFQRWLLVIVSILIILYLYYWAKNSKSNLIKFSLYIMVGGALGNVFDRIVYGEVIDFISLHVFNYYWYVFNIADVAIVLSGLLILIFLTKDSFKKS